MNKDTFRQALVILVLIVVIGINILVNTLASVSYNIPSQLLNPGEQRHRLFSGPSSLHLACLAGGNRSSAQVIPINNKVTLAKISQRLPYHPLWMLLLSAKITLDLHFIF